jgi:Flp pilus assembly protein TadD
LYLGQKNYDYAIQTLQHILKINPNDTEVIIDLGSVFKQKGDFDKALYFFSKAVELEPTKPKSLDFLVDISIIIGNKELAKSALKKLKEVNPENGKIEEFEQRICDIK